MFGWLNLAKDDVIYFDVCVIVVHWFVKAHVVAPDFRIHRPTRAAILDCISAHEHRLHHLVPAFPAL